ncbi:MAG: XRE family transcriptional regulator [Treponema sp.]|jgi:putative transcriptional regulator|nr:XRE family transcriptional regulator [Treponema sp.]
MKKYKSPVFRHIHQEATDLFSSGMITAAEMREFDQSCLVSRANTSSSHSVRKPSPAPVSAVNQK